MNSRHIPRAIIIAVSLLAHGCRVEVSKTVPLPTSPEAPSIRLAVHLMVGTKIAEPAVLENTHIRTAEAKLLRADLYQVQLNLTDDGSKVVQRITRDHIGKRLAFLLNGDIKSSPEIMTPLDIPYIMLPIYTTQAEAERTAAGINNGESQQ